MANAQQIIQYLRGCYEADNRQTGIFNLLHKSIRHTQFLHDEDQLLRGLLDYFPLTSKAAERAEQEAVLYRREKTLLFCSFPIIGRLPARGARPATTLCAPLFLFPAQITSQGGSLRLQVDLASQQVNVPVLAEILACGSSLGTDVDALLRSLPRAPLDQAKVHVLIALLQDAVPGLDALPLSRFPELQSDRQIRAAFREVDQTNASEPLATTTPQPLQLTCLPGCAVALTPNSPNTRGVLHELECLGQAEAYSPPLRHLLGEPAGQEEPTTKQVSRVPAVLSQAQRAALGSAASAPISMLVGPPGTGKSYTIAAIAVDHIARGESVLIACRKQPAVSVVSKMIREMLGKNQCIIEGGEPENIRQLKRFLEGVLQGIKKQIRSPRAGKGSKWQPADRQLNRLASRLRAAETKICQLLDTEDAWGKYTDHSDHGALTQVWRRWRAGYLGRWLEKRPPIWEVTRQYESTLQGSNSKTRELLKQRINARIAQTLQKHRQDLSKFLSSIRSRSSTRQAALFSEIDPNVLFQTFPVWLTNMADIAELVPLETARFDVVIIDEASQCDIASSLPVLQRAKRAVVVGDAKQLRHLTFLPRQTQQRLARQHDLTETQTQQFGYRTQSLLDCAGDQIASQRNVHFLNEHFRSLPQIIAFSNTRFYHDALSVMRLRPSTEAARSVIPVRVEGEKKGGANPAEAEAVIASTRQLIQAQANQPPALRQSIGILSPFRDQVDLIAKRMPKEFTSDELLRHDIRIGTAHEFQGDQRDVMLLSWVVDADAHSSSIRFLDNENLFNVAITRARHQQQVFHSVEPRELPDTSLLRAYLESIRMTPAAAPVPTASIADQFGSEVQSALQAAGVDVWPEYELAGQRIDLVAQCGETCLGIDLVGYAGQYAAILELERYRILGRAGMQLFPLPYRVWNSDRDACLAAILGRLRTAPSSDSV